MKTREEILEFGEELLAHRAAIQGMMRELALECKDGDKATRVALTVYSALLSVDGREYEVMRREQAELLGELVASEEMRRMHS